MAEIEASNGSNENEADEDDEEEEEEEPDNLTFGEKTLGLLVEGMNEFQKTMLEYLSISSRQANETNTNISNMSKKIENFPLMAKGSSSSSSASNSSSTSLSPLNSFFLLEYS